MLFSNEARLIGKACGSESHSNSHYWMWFFISCLRVWQTHIPCTWRYQLWYQCCLLLGIILGHMRLLGASLSPLLCCVHGLWDHPHGWWFTKKTHRTQYVVIITAMVHNNKWIQSQISRRKRHMETRRKPQSLPPVVTQEVLISPSNVVITHVGYCQPGKFIRI